jgi:MurNAc alpha-1-phosphate uridylyltransferase
MSEQQFKGSTKMPETAMVLAAGLGKRMRPITDTIPKPLVRVFGKALLDYGLDALVTARVKKTVVNTHYLGEQIEAHLANRSSPEIILSDERDQLLDSGGGVKKALDHFGNEPFYLLNADSFWLEGIKPNLELLANTFDESKMDIILLLSGYTNAIGYNGSGDFEMASDGRLERRTEKKMSPFAYAGAAIFHPRIFTDTPDGPFSLNLLFDRAIESGRLYGARMEGLWLHVGTPDAIAEAEQAIAQSAA